jgi:hypothetical protein
MASITVNRLTTSNTAPMITGTVQFERYDSNRNPKETIQIVVNYRTYDLFRNVGLDETVKPNIWKLHFPEAFINAGTYDVEAKVIDVATEEVVAKDNTIDELIIRLPTAQETAKNNLTLLQKVALVSALMNDVQRLFGGQNGIGGNPSVHPTLDDDSSTSLAGRADQERAEDQRAKDKKKRQTPNKNAVPPKKHAFAAVDSAALADGTTSGADIDPPDSASILRQAAEAVQSAPDTAAAAAQQQYSSTPTSSLG